MTDKEGSMWRKLIVSLIIVSFSFAISPEKVSLEDVNRAITQLKKARQQNNRQEEKYLLDWIKKTIINISTDQLKSDFCSPTSAQIQKALTIIRLSRNFELYEIERVVTEWVRNAFVEYARLKSSTTISEKELNKLIQTALSLGLGDLAESLASHGKIQSICLEKWKGSIYWKQINTPAVENIDLWSKINIKIEFVVSVDSNQQIHGLGKGNLIEYWTKIVCSNGEEKIIPSQISDPVFPVEIQGIKEGNFLKFTPYFNSRVNLGYAYLECDETNIGEVTERTINLGKVFTDILSPEGNKLLQVLIKGNTGSFTDKESGLTVTLTKIANHPSANIKPDNKN